MRGEGTGWRVALADAAALSLSSNLCCNDIEELAPGLFQTLTQLASL